MKIAIRTMHDPKLDTDDTKINDALQAVNGKAVEHTYSHVSQIWALAVAAEARLEALGIAKKQRAGAFFVATSGDTVPKKYKYGRNATFVRLERGATNWFITRVEKRTIFCDGGSKMLFLTANQDAAAIAKLRQGYQIAQIKNWYAMKDIQA